MLADRITLALDRIDRAASRIENAAASRDGPGGTVPAERYDALRDEAARALAELDVLIGQLAS